MSFHPNITSRLPRSLDHGIGIVGAGGIVQYGHLPAYRKAGFRVAGIASRSAESVERVGEAWGVERRFTDWRRLLDLPEVEVVDITYPFDEERLEIVRAAAERGKHILMQKPLAHSLAAAEAMVEIARRHGVLLAVNHNARWCPQYRAARCAIEQGLLGAVYFLTHEMQNTQDSQPWFADKWYARQERFLLSEYSVHHLDLMRFWTGAEPLRVKASIARKPNQQSRGEMIAAVQLEFPDGALGVVTDDNAAFPQAEVFSRFKLAGTEGLADGLSVGDIRFSVQSNHLEPGMHTIPLDGAWFPDGFIGTMGELLCAIEEGRAPSISGEDNLGTLRIVEAAYASVESGDAVRV